MPVGRRRVIVLLLLTAVLLLTVDLRGNTGLDRVRSGFVWALAPFETAAQVVTRPVVNAWRGVVQYDELRDENLRLQAQLDAQRGAEIAARNAVAENQRLRALSELESLADIPTVTASIIGESPSNIDQIIEIDRGSREGIEVGMAVVNEAGLIGKVTRVFPESSLVMLITDPRYAVEVKVLSEERPEPPTTDDDAVDPDAEPDPDAGTDPDTDAGTDPDDGTDADPDADAEDVTDAEPEPDADDVTGADPDADPAVDGDAPPGADADPSVPPVLVQRETGALLGQGSGRLPQVTFVTNAPTLGRIMLGDTVFTTGGRNSLAPPDIPVGVVANVISRPGSGGTRLEVDPAADLDRLQFVRVVLYKPPVEMGG